MDHQLLMPMMKLKLAIIVACALLVSACSNDMNAGDYTFACDEQTPCAEGFFCSPSGVCVEDGTDVSGPTDASDSTEDTAPDTTDTVQDTEDDAEPADASDASDSSDTEEDTAGDAEEDTAGDAEDADSCVVQTWYLDCDDDGFAGTTTEACDMPTTGAGDCPIDGNAPEPRWKSASQIDNTEDSDCDDNDPRARPDQTEFFATQREGVGGFDFDCDNEDTQRYTAVSTGCQEADRCNVLGSRCNPTPGVLGWQNSLADCGTESLWVNGCSDECVGDCTEARLTVERTQSCN